MKTTFGSVLEFCQASGLVSKIRDGSTARCVSILGRWYDIVFHRVARADLFDIYDYIARQSDPIRASDFLRRIEEACTGLKDFPEKGAPRDDVAVGLRTWAIERRVLIVYRLSVRQIEILRILYAGRDFRADSVPH